MIESAWRVHVAPKWGRRQVSSVTIVDVEAWIAQMMREGRGVTTVLRAHGVLSGVLQDAVKSRRLAVNPARGIDGLPRKTVRRHVYLSADDVHRLAAESGERRPLVYLLAFCGLRWGEAIALRVSDVEFLKRRLVVSESAVQLGVDHAVGQTKGRTIRSVPVPSFVLNELSPLCAGPRAERSRVPRPGRQVSASAEIDPWLVRGRGHTRKGAEDHAARSEAHRGQPCGVRGRERSGLTSDARTQVREGHSGHLRGPVRYRP